MRVAIGALGVFINAVVMAIQRTEQTTTRIAPARGIGRSASARAPTQRPMLRPQPRLVATMPRRSYVSRTGMSGAVATMATWAR